MKFSSSEVMPPPRNRYGEAVESFKNLPNFPGGNGTWEEFQAQYAVVLHETPFAITLQKGPEERVGGLQIPQVVSREHTFFGLLATRDDRKLGKLCFGQESEDFGGVSGLSRMSFFVVDGFDRKFLRVLSSTEGNFLYGTKYKVTGMETQFDSVMSRLTQTLTKAAGDWKSCPNEVQAADLVKIRRHMREFIPHCQPLGKVSAVLEALELISGRIDLWAERLKVRRTDLHRELREVRSSLRHLKR